MMNYRNLGPLVNLSREEMEFVIALPAKDKKYLIISGYVDFTLHRLVMFRGDGEEMNVSLAFFEPNPKQSPDFDKFEIIDHGLTLKFGDYEASVDCVLYDYDPLYKKQADDNLKKN